MNNIIFVIGPVWKNLETLLKTIEINRKMLKNIKKFYIPTNHKDVEKYFNNNPSDDIICKFYFENKNHQLSCFNGLVSGMQMVMEYEKDINGDIVIFSHEDCYVKNLDLFENALKKITQENYEIVCREFDAPACKNHYDKYYMFDTFFIRKDAIEKYFKNEKILKYFYDFGEKPKNYKIYHSKDKKFCEAHFTRIIQEAKIFSILYSGNIENRLINNKLETLGTWKNTELGFFHIPGRR